MQTVAESYEGKSSPERMRNSRVQMRVSMQSWWVGENSNCVVVSLYTSSLEVVRMSINSNFVTEVILVMAERLNQ